MARRAVNLHGCALPHCAPPFFLLRGYPGSAKLVLPPLAYSHRGYPTGAKLEVGWGASLRKNRAVPLA